MTTAAAARKMEVKPLDVRLAATRLLQWLDQGATPKIADVELVAKSYLSLSRPQAGTLRGIVSDEKDIRVLQKLFVMARQYATLDGSGVIRKEAGELLEAADGLIDRLTTPPATEKDA